MSDATEYQIDVKFKKLYLFVLASSALIATGLVLSESRKDWVTLLLLLYCNVIGVFLVYRLNDCIDQDVKLELNIRNFFKNNLHKFVVAQFIFIVIPIALYWFNTFRFSVLGAAAIVGLFYSLSFNSTKRQWRIKNLFIIKNIAIGFGWGALVLIGAGEIQSPEVQMIFGFTVWQVIIGSAIRDIPDLEKDQKNGVKSFAVVFGIEKAILLLHLLNFLSIGFVFFIKWEMIWFYALGDIILWRMLNLIMLQHFPENRFWSQAFNLLTCVVIFILALIV